MNVFFYILSNNIIPIFLLIALGYCLNKKFDMDIYTLSKLNFYVFVPVFILVSLYTTKIPIEMLKVLLFAILILISNMLLGTLICRIRRYDISLTSAFKNSIMFYNSGNIGVPVVTLVFSSAPFIVDGKTPWLDLAVASQIMVLVLQNVSTNTFGFFNAGRANMKWQDSIKQIFKMPTVYAIPTALILKALPFDMTMSPVWTALTYARNALIPTALITLGIQLSKTAFEFKNKEVYLSVFTRLIGGPMLAFIFINIMGFEGVIAQALMISSSVPTSVNSALIAVEFNNEPNFASQVVMTSTILSAVTLTLVIFISRMLFPIV